jgi:CubicO group peptidase (beta-lactamase class C family)
MRALHRLWMVALTAWLALGATSAARANGPEEKTSAAVDAVFTQYAMAGSPGCALGVYRDGKIVYSKGYGLANLEENVPITPQSVFDLGSTSKQFTAASILLLEHQGKLRLDDDIRKYLPELPDYGQKITILNLLNHTSGLRDYLVLMELAGIHLDGVTTDEDALELIARQKALNFTPGSEFLYSNTGYFLLSVIVKRVSGKTLREFAAENIFAPLEMSHTQYRDNHTALVLDRAMAYDKKEKGDGYNLDVSYFEQTGDGAVHTSVEDLQKWDENFYTGQVGGKELLAELQERGKLNNGIELEYAKGLFIADYRGLRTVSHGGAWGGYRAELVRFPGEHFSVACLCNLGNANPSKLAREVADVYLANLLKPHEVEKKPEEQRKELAATPLTAEHLRDYAGDYWSDELGVAYRFEVVEEKLRMTAIVDSAGFTRSGGLPQGELVPIASDEFRMTRAPVPVAIHFLRDTNSALTGFTLDAGRTKGMIFKRKGSAEK